MQSFLSCKLLFSFGEHGNAAVCRQEDDNYEQSSDVRAQLKFFEQLDQLEKQRKEEQEREILLKAAKVRCPKAICWICTILLFY